MIQFDTLAEMLPLRSQSCVAAEKNLILHAMISSFGHNNETRASYRWNGLERGNRDFAVFQLTLSGCGRLDHEGRAFDLEAGDAFFVNIPHDHSYYLPAKSGNWEFAYVVVYGAEIMRLVKSFLKRSDPVIRLAADSTVYAVLCAIHALTDTSSPFKVSELAYSLLMAFLGETSIPRSRTSVASHAVIQRAKRMIEDGLMGPLDVGGIAGKLGLSRHYFSRLFKSTEGISPHDYISHQRHKKALNLLYVEDKAVKEIAFLCGYKDVNYFCRSFKRITGLSPGSYRKTGI